MVRQDSTDLAFKCLLARLKPFEASRAVAHETGILAEADPKIAGSILTESGYRTLGPSKEPVRCRLMVQLTCSAFPASQAIYETVFGSSCASRRKPNVAPGILINLVKGGAHQS